MPIYVHRCPECGHEIEELMPMGSKLKVVCVKCGAEMRRVISPGSFILKGKGWYKTDFKDKR